MCFISTSCNTHFKICLRNGGTSHSNNGGCLSGTSLNPGDVGGNDINFGSTIGNINNPFSYSGSTISQVYNNCIVIKIMYFFPVWLSTLYKCI